MIHFTDSERNEEECQKMANILFGTEQRERRRSARLLDGWMVYHATHQKAIVIACATTTAQVARDET